MVQKISTSILIYSPAWPVNEALVCLCKANHKNVKVNIVSIFEKEDVFRELMFWQPDILVMDMVLRENCGLMVAIRERYPSIPIIITQSRFLFSDKIVAEYFSHVWLKEYNALVCGYPTVLLQEHLTETQLSGTENGGNPMSRRCSLAKSSMTDVMYQINSLIHSRLFDLAGSPRLCEVVLEWLVRGIPAAEVSISLNCSKNVIYHYRWRVMKLLGIHNFSRDFIPSLTARIRSEEINEKEEHTNAEKVFVMV